VFLSVAVRAEKVALGGLCHDISPFSISQCSCVELKVFPQAVTVVKLQRSKVP
jgi:hypothetical protein